MRSTPSHHRAVYAGSFDPITNGHLWMIEQGSRMFDELFVAIGINADKKYLFSLDDRMAMLRDAVKSFQNVTVASFENLFLVHYARQVSAGFILRGIRNEVDYGYERGMRYINAELNGDVLTTFLMPPREYAEISSSFVKGLVGPAGWEDVVAKYVPPAVHAKFLDRFGARDQSMDQLRDIAKAMYDDPPRAYHDWRHVESCLGELAHAQHLCADVRSVEIALWFHDAIYDPQRNDNEQRSADAAADAMRAVEAGDQQIATVRQLILDTQHHGEPSSNDGRIVADIDLAILGQSPEAFAEYERAIRLEYAHVSGPDFARGRAAVLKRFLDRPSIYWTSHFRDRYEKVARKNLSDAIARWTR